MCLVVVIYMGFDYLFIVRQVDCYEAESQCESSMQGLADKSLGRNMVLDNFDDLIEQLADSQVDIQEVQMARYLPGKVSYVLQRAEILGIVESSNSARLVVYSNLYATDSATITHPNSIELSYKPQIVSGEKVTDAHLINSFNLLAKINSSYIGYEKFVIATDSAALVLNPDSQVLLDPQKADRSDLLVLQLLLKELKDKLPYLIDLRFDKPTITQEPPEALDPVLLEVELDSPST